MPTFREYLFLGQRPTDGEKNQGEGTKAWLDVMVWSSAQPHSVGDMVGKCFGAAEGARSTAVVKNGQIVSDAAANGEKEGGDLVAIWARDTLGLSEVQYRESSHLDSFLPDGLHLSARRFLFFFFGLHQPHSQYPRKRSLILISLQIKRPKQQKTSRSLGPPYL